MAFNDISTFIDKIKMLESTDAIVEELEEPAIFIHPLVLAMRELQSEGIVESYHTDSLALTEARDNTRDILIEYSRAKTAEMVGDKILQALANDTPQWGPPRLVQIQKTVFEEPWQRQRPEVLQSWINEVLVAIEDADPTPNKVYTPWLARMYAKGDTKLEDLNRQDVLRIYDLGKKRRMIKPEHSDINRFKTYREFETMMFDNYEFDDIENIAKKEEEKGKAKKVYEDDTVTVIVPEDTAAACRYGRGTRWCTAAVRGQNYFDQYNRQGNLYILIPKTPTHEGEKYQLHFPSDQFMDENDHEVYLPDLLSKRFSELIPFFKQHEPKINNLLYFADVETITDIVGQIRELTLARADEMVAAESNYLDSRERVKNFYNIAKSVLDQDPSTILSKYENMYDEDERRNVSVRWLPVILGSQMKKSGHGMEAGTALVWLGEWMRQLLVGRSSGRWVVRRTNQYIPENAIIEASPNTLEGSFTPDLVESKTWLAKMLAKGLKGKNAGTIYVLGSWYGNMGIFLQQAGVKFDKLVLIEPNEKWLRHSKELLDTLNDEGKLVLIHQKAEDVVYKKPGVVINTSCNETGPVFLTKLPDNMLCLLQARNNVDDVLISTEDLQEFDELFPLGKTYYTGERELADPETDYTRYMKIGRAGKALSETASTGQGGGSAGSSGGQMVGGPTTYEQEYDMFKRKGPRRIIAMTNEAYDYENDPLDRGYESAEEEEWIRKSVGYWITDTGEILPCVYDVDNVDYQMHHNNVANVHLNRDDDDGMEIAYDSGWVRVRINDGVFNIEYYSNKITPKAKRMLLKKIDEFDGAFRLEDYKGAHDLYTDKRLLKVAMSRLNNMSEGIVLTGYDYEDTNQQTVTLNQIYKNNRPDHNERIWDYGTGIWDTPFEIGTIGPRKLDLFVCEQYGVEFIEDLFGRLSEEQHEIVDKYINDPDLSNSIIVLDNGYIVDGNHRAIAAALTKRPIKYIDIGGEELFEAAYDSMITSMKQKFPNQTNMITQQVNWAKQSLKKADRIVWYLRIVQAFISDNLGTDLLGDYKFQSLEQLQADITHFYGYQYAPIENYVFQKQKVSDVISDLGKFEDQWKKKQNTEKGVEPRSGDYKLLEFGGGYAWWFVNRAYCSDEGRSGSHCGNIAGKQKRKQRILSFRNANNQVLLTFILEPNGSLGEMKAKNNQKPSEKFHPYIVKLLDLSMITGIADGKGQYAPDANFNMFDLTEQQLNYFLQKKPALIETQVSSTPVQILKAPDSIRNNSRLQQIAISQRPGLAKLFGDINTENWSQAVTKDPSLIIYAPHDIPDFQEKLLIQLQWRTGQQIASAPASISKNFNLLKTIISAGNPGAIGGISPNLKGYTELCELAVSQNGNVLQFVPEERRTERMCFTAVSKDGYALQYVPEELRTERMCFTAVSNKGSALGYVSKELRTERMCFTAVSNNGYALQYVPEELKTERMCFTAVSKDGNALQYVPEELKTERMCFTAVSKDGYALQYVPEELKTEQIYLALVKNDGSALRVVPKELRTERMCFTAVSKSGRALGYVPDEMKTERMCFTAVSNYGSALGYVPEELKTERMCFTAVSKDGYALQYVPKEMQTERLCLMAVSQTARALAYVSKELRTERLCLTAVRESGRALGFVPEELRTERMCFTAVSNDGYALQFVPDELKTEKMCLTAVSNSGYALGFVPEELKTERMCFTAVSNYSNALEYVPKELKRTVRKMMRTNNT